MAGGQNVYLIVVNYNGYKDTVEFIESANKLQCSNYHIIVVDNASNGNDADRLAERDDIYLIRLKENMGFSGGNNLGIQHALKQGADYIVLINNDTTVEPDFLSHAIEALEKDPSIGVVTGKIMYYTKPETFWFAGGRVNPYRGRAYHLGNNEADLNQYNTKKEISFCTGCLMVIAADALKKVGMMAEDYFLYFEDVEYSARFISGGYKIVYIPEVKIYHKIGSSMGNGTDLYYYYNWRNRLYYIKAYIHGIQKATALLFYSYEGIKNILTGSMKAKVWMKAISDYLGHVKGKVKA